MCYLMVALLSTAPTFLISPLSSLSLLCHNHIASSAISSNWSKHVICCLFLLHLNALSQTHTYNYHHPKTARSHPTSGMNMMLYMYSFVQPHTKGNKYPTDLFILLYHPCTENLFPGAVTVRWQKSVFHCCYKKEQPCSEEEEKRRAWDKC